MEINKIKKILEDFYNGEATPEDEQLLLQYFRSENVVGELLDEKDTFLSAYDSSPIEVPQALEARLSTLIDKLAQEEDKATVIQLKQQRKRKISQIMWVGGVAACLVALVSIGIHFNKVNDDKKQIVQVDNAEDEKKMKEAEEALMLLSSNFNKGIDKLSLASSNLNKTNEILNKTLNRKKDKQL